MYFCLSLADTAVFFFVAGGDNFGILARILLSSPLFVPLICFRRQVGHRVDGWIVSVSFAAGRTKFGVSQPADHDEARRYFGPRVGWFEVSYDCYRKYA